MERNQPETISDDGRRVRAEEQAAETEGFEDAEGKLIENAGHGEGNALPDEFSGETESDLSGAEYGEPDEVDPADR